MDRLDTIRSEVRSTLVDLVGNDAVEEHGEMFVRFGSTTVWVTVTPLTADSTLVKSFAFLLLRVPLSAELFRWVATEGQEFFFGKIRVVENGDGTGQVVLEHNLLGETLDRHELDWAVVSLGKVADAVDNLLHERFMGLLPPHPAGSAGPHDTL